MYTHSSWFTIAPLILFYWLVHVGRHMHCFDRFPSQVSSSFEYGNRTWSDTNMKKRKEKEIKSEASENGNALTGRESNAGHRWQ
jgi:hypothetical protein